MSRIKASIDRIEGDFAVLIIRSKSMEQLIVPMSLMPKGASEKDIVSINILRDKRETEIVKRQVSELLKELTSHH